MNKKYLVVLTGATAIGKSALAVNLAEKLDSHIISADSRQFYKEMHIGTAVPNQKERQQVTHHFVQHQSIFKDYNAGDFERDALRLLQQLFEKKNCVLMVGGSGLYLNAVTQGLHDFPDIPNHIRTQLVEEYKNRGLQYLQYELQKKDEKYYSKVAQKNPRRLIRALEVIRFSGKPYSFFLEQSKEKRPFISLWVGLRSSRQDIYDRINLRVHRMINEGLVEEARSLYQYRHLNALQTVGYKELFNYFEEKYDLETAISEIAKNTRRYAKRQLTWFRKNPNIHWFDHPVSEDEVIEYIRLKTKTKNES